MSASHLLGLQGPQQTPAVRFVIKASFEKTVWLDTLNQFMRTKNLSNAIFVTRNFPEKSIVVDTFHQFMEKHLVIQRVKLRTNN